MWKELALAGAIGVASTQLAFAQSVDPIGANRSYPVYAEPGQHYYNGQLQGSPSGAAAVATAPVFESRSVALPSGAAVGPAGQSEHRTPAWSGQQDEVGVDLHDRASSPYAGGTGG
jgi:hypothetical protein